MKIIKIMYKGKHIVIKRKKYLTGHSYASPIHIQYSYSWSDNIEDARRMNKIMAERFADDTGGKILKLL